jgi:hypothetical protein
MISATGHRGAHRHADNRLLRDRRVPDPVRPELIQQADRRLEHAAGRADVLAQANDRRIAAHLPRQSVRDRVPVGDQVRHW